MGMFKSITKPFKKVFKAIGKVGKSWLSAPFDAVGSLAKGDLGGALDGLGRAVTYGTISLNSDKGLLDVSKDLMGAKTQQETADLGSEVDELPGLDLYANGLKLRRMRRSRAATDNTTATAGGNQLGTTGNLGV